MHAPSVGNGCKRFAVGTSYVINAHDFLKDAAFWKNGARVSLRNLCDYAQLYFEDEMKKLKSEENRFSVEGVMVYFDKIEDVCGYDVRYRYDGKDAYVLRATIDADGRLWWELLKGEVWI